MATEPIVYSASKLLEYKTNAKKLMDTKLQKVVDEYFGINEDNKSYKSVLVTTMEEVKEENRRLSTEKVEKISKGLAISSIKKSKQMYDSLDEDSVIYVESRIISFDIKISPLHTTSHATFNVMTFNKKKVEEELKKELLKTNEESVAETESKKITMYLIKELVISQQKKEVEITITKLKETKRELEFLEELKLKLDSLNKEYTENADILDGINENNPDLYEVVLKNVKTRFFNFNHYKFYIYIYNSSNNNGIQYFSFIPNTDMSIKTLWNYAMCHWYLTNFTTGSEAWPGSCTGFTDFLTFCIGGDNIFKTCRLTKSKQYTELSVEEQVEEPRPKKSKPNPKFKSKKSKSIKPKKSTKSKSIKPTKSKKSKSKKSKSKKSKSKKSNLKF